MKMNGFVLGRSFWMSIPILFYSAAPLSAEQFGLFTYEVVGDSIEITYYPRNETGAVEIPGEIDGKPVTSIGEHAFEDCRDLTSVTIPEGITAIGERAFRGCKGLRSITIADSVTSIGGAAFSFCSSLRSIPSPFPSRTTTRRS